MGKRTWGSLGVSSEGVIASPFLDVAIKESVIRAPKAVAVTWQRHMEMLIVRAQEVGKR